MESVPLSAVAYTAATFAAAIAVGFTHLERLHTLNAGSGKQLHTLLGGSGQRQDGTPVDLLGGLPYQHLRRQHIRMLKHPRTSAVV
jgi:hypothetical protein